MTEIPDRQFRSAVDQVIPLVPDLASRRFGGCLPSALERRPLAVRRRLTLALGEVGVDQQHPEVQEALPKMECYTLLGAVNNELYPAMVDGHGHEARFNPATARHFDQRRHFKDAIQPLFQESFKALRAHRPWMQVVSARYDRAIKDYIKPSGVNDMLDNHPALPCMLDDIDGGDLGTTTQELIRLARKLEVEQGQMLPQNASEELVARTLAHRRKVVETYLAPLGIARSTINMGNHTQRNPSMKPLSQLEGRISTLTTASGQTHTAFRRASSENLREVYPHNGSYDVGPTLKCPFRSGGTSATQQDPIRGYMHAAIDLAYEKGYFLRDNDIRAMRGDPQLDIAEHPYA